MDVPPVWTVALLAITWIAPMVTTRAVSPTLGLVCLCAAAALITASLVQFLHARTSVIPRQTPSALITKGIFRLSRNPIYLADLLILAGFSLIWGKPLGLVLVPVLAWILFARFIQGEEARLRAMFGAEFEAYAARTRRWL